MRYFEMAETYQQVEQERDKLRKDLDALAALVGEE